ncbi:A24 family peptidase [Tessaracoccus sp. OS52]|uniref:prepilin peptidase n=1 Tax=Tessaracoccus sp. OS52 TaxID=2886691 RepID=UPI001D12059F|nr:A24 family peptidase [Tessaracoccus sp. OS52]MCC2593426.1 A24 family peptidase [Tessaracoccus sp. OS52]
MNVALVVTVCAASALLHQMLVVPRLPVPAVPAGEAAPDFVALRSRGDLLGVLAASAASATVVAVAAPQAQLPMWFGHLGAGAALAWVDLRTTWLPRILNQLCLLQVAAGALWLALTDPGSAVGGLIGGLAAFGLFHLVWAFGTGFGYGDVRLAGIVGVLAGAGGLDQWLLTVLAGTVIGAAWGIAHGLLRRGTDAPAHFPYGPALWLGPVAAVAISGW